MVRGERTPRDFPALDRLAQTRAEITELIAPELAYGSSADSYDSHARSAAAASVTAPPRGSANSAAWSQAEREAVAAWADDAATMPPRPRGVPNRAKVQAGKRGFGDSIWGTLLRQGAAVWWRNHPAHTAFAVADSALSHVAGRKPYLTLGLAAAIGALLMWIRPWRLVSITGLVFAALKMTDLRAMFGSIRRGG